LNDGTDNNIYLNNLITMKQETLKERILKSLKIVNRTKYCILLIPAIMLWLLISATFILAWEEKLFVSDAVIMLTIFITLLTILYYFPIILLWTIIKRYLKLRFIFLIIIITIWILFIHGLSWINVLMLVLANIIVYILIVFLLKNSYYTFTQKITIKDTKNNNKWMILLTIFMIWSLVISLSRGDAIATAVLENHNLLFVWIIFSIIVIVLNAFWIYFLISRKKRGVDILRWFFILNIVYMIFIYIFIFSDFEFAKQVYVDSRIERWLNPNEDRFTPLSQGLSGLLSILFFLYIIQFINKKKEYFDK
jgi:hypothetical protein